MIRFSLDGREVEAAPGETIWTVAQREGVEIPHLCHLPGPATARTAIAAPAWWRSRASGCSPPPASARPREGMVVRAATERAGARSAPMVFELLLADQPETRAARDATASFARWSAAPGPEARRASPADAAAGARDLSHPAMAVQLDACIQCKLCERACREVQYNDVIGMARRGAHATVVFDLLDPMGAEHAASPAANACRPAPPARCCRLERRRTRRAAASARWLASAPIAASAARSASASRRRDRGGGRPRRHRPTRAASA